MRLQICVWRRRPAANGVTHKRSGVAQLHCERSAAITLDLKSLENVVRIALANQFSLQIPWQYSEISTQIRAGFSRSLLRKVVKLYKPGYFTRCSASASVSVSQLASHARFDAARWWAHLWRTSRLLLVACRCVVTLRLPATRLHEHHHSSASRSRPRLLFYSVSVINACFHESDRFQLLTAFFLLSVKLATVWSPITSLCCLELIDFFAETLIVELNINLSRHTYQ